MCLIEQKSCNLLLQIGKKKRTDLGDGKYKIGALLHFTGKNKRKKMLFGKVKSDGN